MSRILDSGNRRHFDTGAVRDIVEGKGRFDLMPLDIISDFLEHWSYDFVSDILSNIEDYRNSGDFDRIYYVLNRFSDTVYPNIYTAMLEVSKHFEEGCKKYGENNWQKGMPMSVYLDSAIRHLMKYVRGDTDEPHDRAFVWNLLCLLWTQKHKPEMNNLPFSNSIN